MFWVRSQKYERLTQISNLYLFFFDDPLLQYSNHDSILNPDLVTIWSNQMRLHYCHKSATIRR